MTPHPTSPPEPPAVRTDGLVKRFGHKPVLDGIDLLIGRGGVYALLGPNGAGKTTTIRVLTTLTAPSEGTVEVLGHDVGAEPTSVRSKISLTGQFASLDEDLSGLENLFVLGRLHGLGWRRARLRGRELVEEFDLVDASTRPVKTYSGGMRRRLDIAASLVVRPDLLFLDEPTTGLDPRSRTQVWDLVRSLVDDGTTVVLTTQYLDEADALADRVAVIDHGRVVAEGTTGELKALVGGGTLRVRVGDARQRDEVAHLLALELDAPPTLAADPSELSVQTDHPSDAARALARLAADGLDVQEFSLGMPSLDEVFLTLTGRPRETDAPSDAGGTDDPVNPFDPVAPCGGGRCRPAVETEVPVEVLR